MQEPNRFISNCVLVIVISQATIALTGITNSGYQLGKDIAEWYNRKDQIDRVNRKDRELLSKVVFVRAESGGVLQDSVGEDSLKRGEIEVDENGNVKINTKGPSIKPNPADPNVKNNGPHQVISIPEGLEIIQQGVNPDGSLKTHGVVRPTKPMKPEDFGSIRDLHG